MWHMVTECNVRTQTTCIDFSEISIMANLSVFMEIYGPCKLI